MKLMAGVGRLTASSIDEHGTDAPGSSAGHSSSVTISPNEPALAGNPLQPRRRLATRLAAVLSPAQRFDEALEAEYVRFKYAGIHLAHLWSCAAVSTLTLSFAVLWRADIGLAGTPRQYLSNLAAAGTGTYWPDTYWLLTIHVLTIDAY